MWNADENVEHEGTRKVCVCNVSEQSPIVPEMSQTASSHVLPQLLFLPSSSVLTASFFQDKNQI